MAWFLTSPPFGLRLGCGAWPFLPAFWFINTSSDVKRHFEGCASQTLSCRELNHFRDRPLWTSLEAGAELPYGQLATGFRRRIAAAISDPERASATLAHISIDSRITVSRNVMGITS